MSKGGSGTKGNGAAIRWLIEHKDYAGDDCLIWPFSRSSGYGHFGLNGGRHWAHRYMCELVKGPPPSPVHEAGYSCGRGLDSCVNPRHLDWKTPSENQLDRARHGTKNVWGGKGKLSFQKAAEIRALRGKKSQPEIAKMFGVTRTTISAIMIGRTWAKSNKFNAFDETSRT